MVLNVVMVGFFAAVAKVLKPESLRQAVLDSVPPAFKELNEKAFNAGFKYGIEHPDSLPQRANSFDAIAVEV
jgi:2-oxoglutarate ferredoxin oxidoreductase subunit gamma